MVGHTVKVTNHQNSSYKQGAFVINSEAIRCTSHFRQACTCISIMARAHTILISQNVGRGGGEYLVYTGYLTIMCLRSV